jgi:predicted nucleic acid-binding protein
LKICFDTSVLVAALIEDHPHNVPASAAVLSSNSKTNEAIVSAHTLAELYSVLTRTPFSPRIYPAEARLLIDQSVSARMQVMALGAGDYRTVIDECADAGWSGGAIYDALHIRAAIRARCDRLYTFNVKHFRALAPVEFRDKISAP